MTASEWEKCPDCNGGSVLGVKEWCAFCDDGITPNGDRCKKCDGTGVKVYVSSACATCNGKGRIKKND